MDRIIAANSVPLSGADTAPTTGTPQYATSGSPGTQLATIFPAYQYNAIQEEICGVITGAGLALDRTHNNQLVTAIPLIVPGRWVSFQLFAAAGVYNYEPSSAAITSIEIFGKASGGSGAGAPAPTGGATFASVGGGGGEGAFFWTRLTSGFTGGITVTVGAGVLGGNGTTGAGTAYAGLNGNATSFGTFASAPGGYGGTCGANASGGAQGYGAGAPRATGGNILNEGGLGSITGFAQGSGGGISGAGGGRGGGKPVINVTANGGDATAPGGGGGGALSCGYSPSPVNGGRSLDGWVLIKEYQ